MIYYFAYGSNLHPVRLIERVPSAQLMGLATYDNHGLAFHKKSFDGSGKCSIFQSSVEKDLVYGALYKFNPEHKPNLDRIEGKCSGYNDRRIKVKFNRDEISCFTYCAQPSHVVEHLKPYDWYKQLVILGARYLNFPRNYISKIESVKSMDDPDISRQKKNEIIIDKIINCP